MTKLYRYFCFFAIILTLSSFGVHRFYVAIYQINHDSKKKMIQITTRIFIDDLNTALEKKYNKKTNLGDEKETTDDEVLLKKYLSEKFQLKVNGEKKAMFFLSKELENNVLICYLRIQDIPKIKTLEVENSVITEVHEEQQNIIQTNFNSEKQSLLLTSEKTKGMLK